MPGCSWKARGASAAPSAWPNSTTGSTRRSSDASTATRALAPILPRSPATPNGRPRRRLSCSEGQVLTDRADGRRCRGRQRAHVDEIALRQVDQLVRRGGAPENLVPVREAAEAADHFEIGLGLAERELPDGLEMLRRLVDGLFGDRDDSLQALQMIRPLRVGEGKEMEELLIKACQGLVMPVPK